MAKILIVEDDRQFARRMAEELAVEGHSCAVRHQGAGVVEWARTAGLDLLILDVMIPGQSGFEICRSFRKDDALFTLPIMLVSVMSDEEEVRHGLAQGADDYVTKPFEMETFLKRVETLLSADLEPVRVDTELTLTSASGTRKQLQRRISRGQAFALVYVELMNLRDFAQDAGAEGRDKAVRHLARALNQHGRTLDSEDFFVGHMGVGCFACTVPIGSARGFCERITQAWNGHLARLYESVGLSENEDAPSASGRRGPLLAPLFCVTTREASDDVTPQQMLDTVSRLRNKNARTPQAFHRNAGMQGGIVVDGRAPQEQTQGPLSH